eukprot:12886985-Prorocentrum_lima.AAC.1
MCLSEEWKKWANSREDEAFVSTLSLGGGEEEEGLVTALKEKCKDYLRKRGCAKCKKALGQMRGRTHGKSTSQ